jgi:leucyl aminopeptidase (aminopeptidase T)
MNPSRRPVTCWLLALSAVVGLAGCSQPSPEPKPAEAKPVATSAPAVDTKALAAKIVHKNAGVKEGDIVVIFGGGKDLPLLEDLAVEVRKSGAFPLVNAASEQLSRRMVDEVPEKYDSQKPTLDMKLMEMADVLISADYVEHNDLMAGVPPARLAARSAASQPVTQLALKRGVRQVNLGNGLLPTADTAKQFGVPQDKLAEIYWAGVNTDYDKLQAKAQDVIKVLSAGKKVRITNPNGTDLTVGIAGRPVFTSDGVISADDIKRGGAAVSVYLPAGEVYLTPVPGTAEGRIVVDHYFFQGKDVQKLELTFAKGRLTDMKAASGLEPLKAMYDAANTGKDELGVLDLGINPDVQLVPGSRMVAWMPAGMVTIVTGNNIWAGGTNASSGALSPFLPGSSVEVDGQALVKDGKLMK